MIEKASSTSAEWPGPRPGFPISHLTHHLENLVRVLKNLVITLGLFALAVLVGGMINASRSPAPQDSGAIPGVVWLMVIATAVWAGISSSRLEFRKYKTSMSYHPATIFILHVMFWIVVFPYLLTVRDNIKDGSAELKNDYKHEVASPVPPLPQCPMEPPPVPSTRSAQPVPPALPRPQVASVEDRFQQLQQLAQLKDQGILTETEFQSEKQKILGQA